MHRAIIAAALASSLAACAGRPVATFTAADITTAQSLAIAAKDTAGVQCWGAMLPVAQAVQRSQQIGVATATELYRAALLGAEGPCAPIVLPILVKLGPLLGVTGALAALPTVGPAVAP